MKKRFVAKKIKNTTILKAGLFVLIAVLALIISFNTLLKGTVEEILGSDQIENNLLEKGTNKKTFSFKILNPKDLFKLSLNSMFDYELDTNLKDIKMIKNHENASDPLIYIYNTHDKEDYSSTLIESYNIRYNVKMASYILSDYLKDLNTSSFVEETSITEFMGNTDIYENNYDASRLFIERRLKEYPSIKYLIDIHRDAIDEGETTKVEIDGKNYAKLLFVVGEENKDFEKNYALAEKVNSKLDERLTKGIIKKSGEKVNGVYNQDLSPNALLIEVGSEENTIEEVDNSLRVLANVLLEIVGDTNG